MLKLKMVGRKGNLFIRGSISLRKNHPKEVVNNSLLSDFEYIDKF
jgi:hypothetical protein